jgi:DNA-binding NarL/FixJ family response regulator
MIRIVVVDDQELVRTGLRALAEHDGDIVVVAEAPTVPPACKRSGSSFRRWY